MGHVQRQQVGSRGRRLGLLLLILPVFLSLLQPSQATIHIPSNYHISELKRPPVIVTQPESVTVFSVEDLVMTCEASGNPPPIFRWTKDGEEFDPGTDPELKVTERLGSFVFYTLSNTVDSLKQYQGKYVCYASNELGTAVSNEATLKTDAPPSQQKEKKVHVKSEEGSSIVLKCNPPQSSMEPIIHWMDWNLHHIQLSERVVVGKDGNLYFAHLKTTDSRDDYTCNVQYLATRTILAKEPVTLTVNPTNSVLRNRRPHMMRPTGSHSTYHALRGQTIELECIVQGYPTPKVLWVRKDGELSESRTAKEMFDRRLRFTNISESDAGEYQCLAENSQGKALHSYTVAVEAAPYWTKEPVSMLYAPGENVRLDCQAEGIPTPVITWTINGIPLSSTEKDSRRTLTPSGSLILKDVNFGDTAIYQCKASNKHGAILSNTNVYIIELPPQILTEDGNTYTVTEGQKVLLECDSFGSPKPKVSWHSGSASSLLADSRINPLTTGGLEIFNVTHDDEGFYTCSVQNTNLSISAELEVLNRTMILSPPQTLKVQPGQTAIFTCLSLVDPKLASPLTQWRKNDHKLFASGNDLKYTFEGPDLIISDAKPEDEGNYTCQVITNLDMAEATGTLTLHDRPDPPALLQLSQAQRRAVTLSWTPGDEHNSPVIEYVIEFEDQVSNERGWEELSRVSGNKDLASLSLWPYMSYRFRVIAINEVGKSAPSNPTEIHNTAAEAPDNNPEDVRSESTDPDTLVITWEEMDKRDFNGPDFKYRILWRRVVGSGPDWHPNYTTAPPLVVSKIGNFSAFEIKVQAVNEQGEGPEPDPVIGYSGENFPLEAPMNVGIVIMNSTTIRVTWAAIDRETVRGHLLGYKIHLTRFGPRGHHRARRAREPVTTVFLETGANEERKVIGDLQPYSHPQSTVGMKPSRSDPALAPASIRRAKGQTTQTQVKRLSTYSTSNGFPTAMGQQRFLEAPPDQSQFIKTSRMEQQSAINSSLNASDLTIKEAVEFLSHPEEKFQQCGATIIQQTTFKDDRAKQEVLQLGGIPTLVTLLRSPSSAVSQAAAGALRNLVFKNHKNKLQVQHCGGIAKALQLLKETDCSETQKQITGLLWNLSSADELKGELIATALPALTENVVVPFTRWSDDSVTNNIHPEVFYNTTGCLRNLSCAQVRERTAMRDCRGLIDSLMCYLQSCVADNNPEDKSVENCACILHNLTYQLETESPKCFADFIPSTESQSGRRSPTVGCFSPKSGKVQKQFSFDNVRGMLNEGDPTGAKWLCHPKAMQTYLSLLSSSQKDATLEACCGALQNLTASKDLGSSAMSQILVQKLGALMHIAPLLRSPKSSLQKAAVSLLGNIGRTSGLQATMAKQVLPELTSLLAAGPRELGNSDENIATACNTVRNLMMADTEVNKKFIDADLVSSLADLSGNGSFPKASKAASVLLYHLWNDKNLQSILKKLGMSKSLFVNDGTTAAYRSVQIIE